jgi:hypothetical protein
MAKIVQESLMKCGKPISAQRDDTMDNQRVSGFHEDGVDA